MLKFVLPAVAMMLGWGLRGFIGGGPLGAMIPGALVVLTLCLIHPRRDVAALIAFGAIGVGFGGEMTYGQTVGFIVHSETFWWGLLGLTVKGAIWGLLAGAVIGLGFTPRLRLVGEAAVVMCAACWIGWKLINEPKLIYFSNRLDKPRPEIWVGFALAAVALLGWLAWRGAAQPALRFAIAGLVGGGIGFGAGGTIHGLCTIYLPHLLLHSWKYMEFCFGFCFGWALAWAWDRSHPKPGQPPSGKSVAAPVELAAAAVLTGAVFALEAWLPLRFAALVTGSATLVLICGRPWLARQLALTVTFTAAAFDLAKHTNNVLERAQPQLTYVPAVAAGLLFAWAVRRCGDDVPAQIRLLMWSCVAIATVKFAIAPTGIVNLLDGIELAFVLMAIAVDFMLRRYTNSFGTL